MKIKQVLFLSLTIFMILPFVAIKAGAIKTTLLENQSHWAEITEAPVRPNNALNPVCVYYADREDNCLYLSLSIGQKNETMGSVSAQVILKTRDWKQLVEISSEAYETHKNGVASQASSNSGQNGYFHYTFALEFKEKTAYEVTPVFLVNGAEIRLKSTIHFDSTVPTTEEETVTKAEKNTVAKKGAATNEKETKAATQKSSSKTTTKANPKAVKKSPEKTLKEEMSVEPQETTQVDTERSFFQSMSKPTRVVFIAAVILGALALVAVGMALGNRKDKTFETPQDTNEEEKKE